MTVMVKDCGTPEQPLAGVTTIVAVMGAALAFVATKLAIDPVPLAASPMAVLLFVQVNVAPATELLKDKTPVCSPPQKILLGGTVTSGAGLTVIFLLIVVVPHSFVTSNVIL